MKVITAPNLAPPLGLFEDVAQVFLAGSIEQGAARDWQQELLAAFSPDSDLVFFNPRREVWDEHWFGSTKTLDVTLGRLRQKLGAAGTTTEVVAVRGVGFRLEPADA